MAMSESKVVKFKQEENDVKSTLDMESTHEDKEKNKDDNHDRTNKVKKSSYNTNQQGYEYKGENNDIGIILALRSERFNNKVVYLTFVEKLKIYVLTNFEYARDIIQVLEQLKDPTNDIIAKQPKDLNDADKDSEVAKWMKMEKVKQHIKRLNTLEENKETLYGLIWGQCSGGLQELLKGDDDYDSKSNNFDCLWLLEKVKLISAGVDEKANKYATLVKAITSFCNIRQGPTESNDSFRKRVDSSAQIMELAGGSHVFYSPQVSSAADKDKPTIKEKEDEKQRFKAMIMILRSDPERFGRLQESLFEGVYKGRDEFPETVTSAYDLLQRVASNITPYTNGTVRFSRFRFRRNNKTHVAFTQKGTDNIVPGRDGKIHARIQCHNCKELGHYANQCGKPKIMLAHFILTQNKLDIINRSWLLLDTCSTVSVACNPKIVNHIRECAPGGGITVVTNGGSQTFTQMATLDILPINVHFNEHSIANILSLSDVANLKGARLTMDSEVERAIVLHFENQQYKFRECIDGLYYLDLTLYDKTNTAITAYPSFTTVQSLKSTFTKRDINMADKARRLQQTLAWPSDKTFYDIVEKNLAINCEVSSEDIQRANKIYGTATPLLYGKGTRRKPISKQVQQIPTPSGVLNNYPNLEIFTDFFYVNQVPFLLTTSSKINFLTVQTGANRTKAAIVKGLLTVQNTYKQRGFNITDVHGDNEFDIQALHDALRPATLHIYGRDEHVGPIERAVRTVKDRCRSVCSGLPYHTYTLLMVNSLVEYVLFWLNAFPTTNGASDTLSPANIVTGRRKPDFSTPYLPFGTYAIVFNGTSNNMTSRGIPAIALKPSNDRGGCYFMSILTGKKIHAYQWHELPTPTEVIQQVHLLAKAEGRKKMTNGIPTFEWNIGDPIQDEEIIPAPTIVHEDILTQDTTGENIVIEKENNITEEHGEDDDDTIVQNMVHEAEEQLERELAELHLDMDRGERLNAHQQQLLKFIYYIFR